MANTAVSMPSGNGGVSGVPNTRWVSVTGIACDRPGSASSAVGMRVWWRPNIGSLLRSSSKLLQPDLTGTRLLRVLRETAHVHVQHQPDCGEAGDGGRPPVRQEGQRDADD